MGSHNYMIVYDLQSEVIIVYRLAWSFTFGMKTTEFDMLTKNKWKKLAIYHWVITLHLRVKHPHILLLVYVESLFTED